MLYNHIIIDRISFGSPYERKKQFFIRDEKIIKSVYYADISYNNNCLYVKIPESEIKYIEIKNNDTYCYLRGKKFYSNFIEPLEQYIIHTLYTNSEKWFNGKRFSHEKSTTPSTRITVLLIMFLKKFKLQTWYCNIALNPTANINHLTRSPR